MTAHISDDGLKREESVAEHTEKTMFLCKEKGGRCGLAQVMSLCGVVHDMGKNKEKYNAYLHADEQTRRKLRGTIPHASTGAKYLCGLQHEGTAQTKVMVELISYAVAAHHGLFDCVDVENVDQFFRKISTVEDYEEACGNAERDYLGEYKVARMLADAAAEFGGVWGKIKGLYDRMKSLIQNKCGEGANAHMAHCKSFLFSCLQRLILSLLIDSDWEATSDFMDGVDMLSKKPHFDAERIFAQAYDYFEEYMRDKTDSVNMSKLTEKEQEIWRARNCLQKECRQFASNPAGIYCLPIPTGGGKTLSSLAYALEYCRLHPETERIIYVSPYISVTEQNAKVFREAIGIEKRLLELHSSMEGIEEWLLEHHSSVICKEDAENGDFNADPSSAYEINWEEPFICTTFVQLMNTLFSDKSASIRRMHRLVNAVVIIDEVQSMPLKCVNTFNYMINFLNAVCNTNIILCTATQPTLHEAQCPLCYSKPKYMIEGADSWFRRFERVQICTDEIHKKYTVESLGGRIAEQTANYRTILVVLNTKSAVRRLYGYLRGKGIQSVYLTTNLCAAHRSDLIDEVKRILGEKQEKIVVVSTSLIEAGADISFECVYRSMAGLDSLAQTAGRCNRNGELENGVVYPIRLDDEQTGNRKELQESVRITDYVIYKYCNSGKTDSLLTPKWMDEYYRVLYEEMSDQMNFPIKDKGMDASILELLSEGFRPKEKKRFMNQAYKTAGQAYQVIDDWAFGVIVPYKEGGRIIEDLQKSPSWETVRKCIRQAQRYTVNVRGNQMKKIAELIQPVSERIPNLYMLALPNAYSMDCGIAEKWETLIF